MNYDSPLNIQFDWKHSRKGDEGLEEELFAKTMKIMEERAVSVMEMVDGGVGLIFQRTEAMVPEENQITNIRLSKEAAMATLRLLAEWADVEITLKGYPDE